MKTLLTSAGIIFLILAALATPIGIGTAIYGWAFADIELSMALWEGFKTWITMLGAGLLLGYPLTIAGASL